MGRFGLGPAWSRLGGAFRRGVAVEPVVTGGSPCGAWRSPSRGEGAFPVGRGRSRGCEPAIGCRQPPLAIRRPAGRSAAGGLREPCRQPRQDGSSPRPGYSPDWHAGPPVHPKDQSARRSLTPAPSRPKTRAPGPPLRPYRQVPSALRVPLCRCCLLGFEAWPAFT